MNFVCLLFSFLMVGGEKPGQEGLSAIKDLSSGISIRDGSHGFIEFGPASLVVRISAILDPFNYCS